MSLILDGWTKKLHPNVVNHLSLNYSDQELGARHPKGPVGWMIRDNGVLDLYSGSSRLLLNIDGDISSISKRFGVYATEIHLSTPEISNLKILGKSFNKEIFNGHEVLTTTDSLEGYSVIGPNTVVSGNKIIGTTPLSEFIKKNKVFDDPPSLLSLELESFFLVAQTIGKSLK